LLLGMTVRADLFQIGLPVDIVQNAIIAQPL
jgi:hypothetical protein